MELAKYIVDAYQNKLPLYKDSEKRIRLVAEKWGVEPDMIIPGRGALADVENLDLDKTPNPAGGGSAPDQAALDASNAAIDAATQ